MKKLFLLLAAVVIVGTVAAENNVVNEPAPTEAQAQAEQSLLSGPAFVGKGATATYSCTLSGARYSWGLAAEYPVEMTPNGSSCTIKFPNNGPLLVDIFCDVYNAAGTHIGYQWIEVIVQ